MKTDTIKISLILIFTVLQLSKISATVYNLTQSSGSFSVTGSNYVNNQSNEWNINTGQNKRLTIVYNIDTESGCDFVTIYEINEMGVEQEILFQSGYSTGQITTNIASGRAKVVFTTDQSICGADANRYYTGFTCNYALEETYAVNQNLYVEGNTTLNGSVNINGSSFSTGTKFKIKLMDFPGHTSWIDMPTVTGRATGIGSGGAGQNAWIAYAGNAAQWFTNSMVGDICYRNRNGKLLFGNTTGTAAMSISSDNVGLGTVNPAYKLHVIVNSGNMVYLTSTNSTISESAAILFQGARGVVGYDGVFQGMRISTSDNSKPIIFTNSLTNGQGELMRINGNGNVGIGTTAPAYKLEVAGSAKINNSLIVAGTGPNIGGAVSISNASKNQAGQASTWTIYNMSGSYGNSLQFWAYDNVGCASGGLCGNRFTITDDGKVGIGTSVIPSDYKLAVNGIIYAKGVTVSMENLADFVFHPSYDLMPLSQVEQFIKANNHLPEIPSAVEVRKNGLSMGEMQNKLLQKIEELTLYIIDQQKQIEKQNAEIEKLKGK